MELLKAFVYMSLLTCSIFANKYVLTVLGFKFPMVFQGWQVLVGCCTFKVSSLVMIYSSITKVQFMYKTQPSYNRNHGEKSVYFYYCRSFRLQELAYQKLQHQICQVLLVFFQTLYCLPFTLSPDRKLLLHYLLLFILLLGSISYLLVPI